MPFVSRCVEPRYLSRTSLRDTEGRPRVKDEELQAVTNCTLAGALKQLASLVLLADDVFNELTVQLSDVQQRSQAVKSRLAGLAELVEKFDPKTVPVPEDSLANFATRKVHFKAKLPQTKELFTPASRGTAVRRLYAQATCDRVPASLLQQLRRELSELQCTPVLTATRRRLRIDAEIDARIPAAVEELRKWTSSEALGDVTSLPDPCSRIALGVTLTPDQLSDAASDDEPIDHQLPSPEEQLRVIISKFAPEVIPIDTTGKFFDRMCTSRKSLHIESNGETDTVKRRTRSRKPRGKRRNTISGTDQKELREAIAGDASNAVASPEAADVVVRSHSSDLLKKSPIDLLSKKPGHFNSLKQWGKSRLRMISRSPSASRDSFRDSMRSEKSTESKSPTRQTQEESPEENVTLRKKRVTEQERRPSHKRCASYSSDDKSVMEAPTSLPITATISAGVKLRTSAAQRRLRRSGLGKEEPHSSSGNWSASSESGRTSIGSEITTTTVPPKSTTSAATSINSLNTHAHGPPSSIISRRRFLNTSGSSSVTSEGTLTPDIIHDPHDDIETSSEYSCDTEGYYTSFHMDSGLKTLKEEESPSSPLHTSNALSNSSIAQNTTAENEYELFGKGSTSTTTSSAGTVCTTLMAAGSDRSLVIGPTVPERKSSLTKLNRSKGSIHSANASLDRNYTSNSVDRFNSLRYLKPRDTEKTRFNFSLPSTNEFSEGKITISSSVGQPQETVLAIVHQEHEAESAKKSTGTSSPDSGHNTSSSPIEDSVSSAQGKHSLSEQDYSESSDLEGTDRIERIRYKTTINSSRIPSLCVITPSNSDDEGEILPKDDDKKPPVIVEMHKKISPRPKLELPVEAFSESTGKEIKESYVTPKQTPIVKHVNVKNSLNPLNSLMCKLKGVLPHKQKKSPSSKEPELSDSIFDAGDYVTIADVRNNNQKVNMHPRGVYGTNDIVKKNLQTVLSGQLPETEYVSLNELPNCLNESKDFLEPCPEPKSPTYNEIRQLGAKVTLDSQGKVIYSSDSIRRRKGAHTTFEPGPFVKDVKNEPIIGHSPGTSDSDEMDSKKIPVPTSPQLGKVIIKAPIQPDGPVIKEVITLPTPRPNTIITAVVPDIANAKQKATSPQKSVTKRMEEEFKSGAYVNIHDAEGVNLSPTRDNITGYRHLPANRIPGENLPKPMHHIAQRLDPVVNTLPRKQYPSFASPPSHPQQTFHRDNSTYWTLRPQRNPRFAPQPMDHVQHNSLDRQRHVPPLATQAYQRGHLGSSPIDRGHAPFQSSTPSRDSIDSPIRMLSPVKSSMSNEELYAVIHKSKKKLNINPERCDSPALSSISLSPVSSESSLVVRPSRLPESGSLGDPRTRNNPTQSGVGPLRATTCADRMGPVPQTSRLDFKRLLLQHGVKLNVNQPTNKLSAVEQLRIDKAKLQAPQHPNSNVNILDLSGSPKTYSQRRIIRAPAPSNSSPSRAGALIKEHKSTPKILLSPKSQWRFSSPRSDVLSSPIPEANNEDDASVSSGEKADSPGAPRQFGARRSLVPINEHAESDCETEARGGTRSARADLQAKRAEFFTSSPGSSPPRLSSFRPPPAAAPRTPSPPALETAL